MLALTWSSDSFGNPDKKQRGREDRGLELRTRLARLGRRGGGEARELSRLWEMLRESREAEASSEDRGRLVRLL